MKEIFKKTITHILRWESQLVLKKYKPKVVAITGSVGKTSTKDAVFAVLSKMAYVRKSEKSYNSQIGLPLTILGIPNAWSDPLGWLKNIVIGFWLIVWPHKYPEWLVLEVGVGKPGDMKETASWLKTDAVIETAIGDTPVHIEFFPSREHLIEEKAGLIKTLKKDGTLILNGDDGAILGMKTKSANRAVTYGFTEGTDLFASGDTIECGSDGEPLGAIFRVDAEGKSLPVIIEGAFGRNHIYAALAALAFAYGQKLNMLTAAEALKNYEMPPGRMRLLTSIKETRIIDDTYNSSPFAAQAALDTLQSVKSDGRKNRKIAVLGDMLELGKHTEEAHRTIGALAAESAKILITVGPRAQGIKQGALDAGMDAKNIFDFADSVQAGVFLKDFIKKGDIILIKGSQGVRMERISAALLQDQENRKKLLVRQEDEWMAKE